MQIGVTGGLWFHELDAVHWADVARHVESLGFESLWVGDHLALPAALPEGYPYTADGHAPFPADTPLVDPLVMLAAMATATSRIRLGTAVYLLPLRAPLAVARAVATVQAVAGGRVTLGIGTGWIRQEFDDAGVGFADRGSRTDEMVALLRALWSGDVVEHHGTHYDVGPVQCLPRPQPVPPVHVGGESRRALRRAGELGAGWIGMNHDPADAAHVSARVRAVVTAAGRDPEQFEVSVQASGVPDADDLAAYRTAGIDRLLVLARPLADGGPGQAPGALDRFVAGAERLASAAGLDGTTG